MQKVLLGKALGSTAPPQFLSCPQTCQELRIEDSKQGQMGLYISSWNLSSILLYITGRNGGLERERIYLGHSR